MGISDRKEREKQNRIDSILDAAEQVFFGKSFKTSNMDEIAERAELSKGTLYLYFKNKEMLFIGIELRGLQTLLNMFEKTVEKHESGADKVRAIGDTYYEFSQRYQGYFKIMTSSQKMDVDLMASLMNEPLMQECKQNGMAILELLAKSIQIGINDGSIRSDIDPMKTAILLWSTSNGVIQMHTYRADIISRFKGYSPDFLLEEYHKLIECLLNPEKGK